MPDECTIELQTKAAQPLTLVNVNSRCNVSVLIDCKKFGTLTKLLKVTAQVLRAIEKFKRGRNCSSEELTMTHLAQVELLWVKDAQSSMIKENKLELHRRQFNLFEDDKGVWCRGRLYCWSAIRCEESNLASQRSSIDHSTCTRSAWTCFPWWNQRDPDRNQKEVLDSPSRKFDKTAHPPMCSVQEAQGYIIQTTTTSTISEWNKTQLSHTMALTLPDQSTFVVLMTSHRKLGFVFSHAM